MTYVLDGGAEGNRTPDLVIANDALSQLSYGPKDKVYATFMVSHLDTVKDIAIRDHLHQAMATIRLKFC